MMHRVILFTTLLSGVALSAAPAQNDAASRAVFEVASIKPAPFPNESYFAGLRRGPAIAPFTNSSRLATGSSRVRSRSAC